MVSNWALFHCSGVGPQVSKSAVADSKWLWGWRWWRLIEWRTSRSLSALAVGAYTGSQAAICQSRTVRQLLYPGANLCSSAKGEWIHPPLTPSPIHSQLGDYIEQERRPGGSGRSLKERGEENGECTEQEKMANMLSSLAPVRLKRLGLWMRRWGVKIRTVMAVSEVLSVKSVATNW